MSKHGDPFDLMKSWRILPVRSSASGEQVVRLDLASQTVAIMTEAQVKIQNALLRAGLLLLQSGLLQHSVKPFIQSKLVQSEANVIKLLVEQKDYLSGLAEKDRHDLLTHFSLVYISDPSQLSAKEIRKLPLFKLASGGNFTDLCQEGVVHCCLHPQDKHAHALEQLMPSSAVMLSFPTEQTKPIYEFLGIQLCNGEDFMVDFVVPRLPAVCSTGGAKSRPYLDELYQFVVVERSQKVTEAAHNRAFVPCEEGYLNLARSLIHPRKDPVACLFANCLSRNLPAHWLQTDRYYLDLLSKLGLKLTIPAPLLLKCAEELHSQRET